MTADLIPTPSLPVEELIDLTLAPLVSPHTRRMYRVQLRKFLGSGLPLNREGVATFLAQQREAGNGAATLVCAVSAIRKLATEAQLRGLIDRDQLEQVESVSPGRRYRTREGLWLTIEQVKAFIALPDRGAWWGRRDAAIITAMLGCGFRRAEMADLKWSQYQERDGRACFVDFVGKGGKLRTVPVPVWAQRDIDRWQFCVENTAEIPPHQQDVLSPSHNFDRSYVAGGLRADRIYEICRMYAKRLGLKLAAHDMRRTLARLLRDSGADLEQIQYTLGHESIQTTMRYLGSKLKLKDAAVDRIALE